MLHKDLHGHCHSGETHPNSHPNQRPWMTKDDLLKERNVVEVWVPRPEDDVAKANMKKGIKRGGLRIPRLQKAGAARDPSHQQPRAQQVMHRCARSWTSSSLVLRLKHQRQPCHHQQTQQFQPQVKECDWGGSLRSVNTGDHKIPHYSPPSQKTHHHQL